MGTKFATGAVAAPCGGVLTNELFCREVIDEAAQPMVAASTATKAIDENLSILVMGFLPPFATTYNKLRARKKPIV